MRHATSYTHTYINSHLHTCTHTRTLTHIHAHLHTQGDFWGRMSNPWGDNSKAIMAQDIDCDPTKTVVSTSSLVCVPCVRAVCMCVNTTS